MPAITMPALTEIPVDVRLEGERGTVAMAVVAVGQCPAGHRFLESVGDVADIEAVAGRQARWAEQHAANCAPVGAQQPVAA